MSGAPSAPESRMPPLAALLLSALFHGAAALAVARAVPVDAPKPKPVLPVLVDIEIVEKKTPPPEPPAPVPPKPQEAQISEKAPAPEPTPPEPETPPPPKKPKPKTRPKKPKPAPAPQNLPPQPTENVTETPQPKTDAPPSDLPPPPNQKAAQGAPKSAPIRIGISLSSTSTAGTFAAPVGNTLYGASSGTAADPAAVQPYAPDAVRPGAPAYGVYVPPAKVTRLPKVKGEVRAVYPEAARRAGLEGQVVLKLRVSDKGKVVEARVVESAGNGFDEAALEAVRRFTFSPGMKDGSPIATDITYTYTFLLD